MTSPLALPAAACRAVHNGTRGSSASVSDRVVTRLAGVNVVDNNSAALRVAAVSGSAPGGGLDGLRSRAEAAGLRPQPGRS